MKNSNYKILYLLFLTLSVCLSSCQKDNDPAKQGKGKTVVTAKMNGIATGSSTNTLAPGSPQTKNSALAIQKVTVPFGKDLRITATLSERTALLEDAVGGSAKKAQTKAVTPGVISTFYGNYTIYVYKQGDSNLLATIPCVFGQNNSFELDPGAYKFVISAFGNPAGTGPDRDPLAQEIHKTITATDNVLDIVLKHLLTEITVEFNAGNGRTISAIGGGTIEPSYNNYTFNEATGVVAFAGVPTARALNFSAMQPGQIWQSDPVIIAVPQTINNGKIKLDPVTINGITGNVELEGLTLRQGVQYHLTLNLGDREGIPYDGETWSIGNLTYNPGTQQYGFSGINGIGNYWFAGRTLPKVVNGNNYGANHLNGDVGDPCRLVKPLNTWRLPTEAEVKRLISSTEARPPKRYTDYYDGTSASPTGVFFGTPTTFNGPNHPGATRDNYVFIVLAGYYSNDDSSVTGTKDREASYMVTGSTENIYKEWFFTGTRREIAYSIPEPRFPNVGRAMQIRCIKR
ncbi:fimbrillin family protein [Sphingobacterium sp. Mn56C]|uniref:fimbrillin family protein n=1 Tax=Sphingobacterium sp. Mn56C TaxID=3395261 RepID=UPI003BCB4F2C